MAQSIGDDAESGKHGTARELAEAALRAEEKGDQALADRLLDQAENTDPEAVENVLRDRLDNPTRLHHRYAKHAGTDTNSGNDTAVASITRTVRPGSDAPDRAGITQSGSGADNERR
ncbi:hypothetical protein [Acetobacter oeni]|uniref:Uncharacterized protein n=1 Tax=Acetobacter oeni TaxID=304077 RepID=A0A511XLX2_9PROT|nr:hypothetical protein [Acetobacter oeni]MBB3882928.1 hypothetical protein [Acetobacter oeni]NHO19010.1 hypothetical protein [Acetobacter oeni]GBR04826.1 hypothetical protein AA21952_1542 [Acetobacter oeni LMG 21952]GEN63950.1 hypothetical protein AOE01nite_21740 [Acetobacter oeni]